MDKMAKDEKALWNEHDLVKSVDDRVYICVESPLAKLR